MKQLFTLIIACTTVCATSFAGTFHGDFSNGLNPTYWTVTQTTPGLYSLNATGGDLFLAKNASSGGLQNVEISLNLSALGGNVSGDFMEEIHFANANIGPADDQVELHAVFANSSLFFNVFDFFGGQRDVHVWDGSNINGYTPEPVTAGTLTISRVGSTVSAYFDHTLFFSSPNSSVLTSVNFILQTQPSSPDTPSVTYSDFSFTADSVPSAVPEPSSFALGALGGLGLAVGNHRRRRAATVN